jgi:hypothetical protein
MLGVLKTGKRSAANVLDSLFGSESFFACLPINPVS